MAPDEIDKMFWQVTTAEAASKAIGHAWVEFKKCPAGFLIEVNDKPALRISIKYRETGPYLSVEQAPGTGETMGSCIRTAGMVQHYVAILEAHDSLGKKLHSARSFIITDEERALAKTAAD
jgi:hypothetical protein